MLVTIGALSAAGTTDENLEQATMTRLSHGLMAAAVLALPFGVVSSAAAQDWPQWRGPARDGVAAAFDVPASWPDTLQRRWSREIGLGYASPVLSFGGGQSAYSRLCRTGRRGDRLLRIWTV